MEQLSAINSTIKLNFNILYTAFVRFCVYIATILTDGSVVTIPAAYNKVYSGLRSGVFLSHYIYNIIINNLISWRVIDGAISSCQGMLELAMEEISHITQYLSTLIPPSAIQATLNFYKSLESYTLIVFRFAQRVIVPRYLELSDRTLIFSQRTAEVIVNSHFYKEIGKTLQYTLPYWHRFSKAFGLEHAAISGYLYAALAVILFSSFIYVSRFIGRQPRLTALEKRTKIYKKCYDSLAAEIRALNCNPILLRLAFSDIQTYDKTVTDWPLCGGANGDIRFEYILNQPVNAGLSKAIDILKHFKCKYSSVSWADLIQMAGAIAVETSGGPKIPMKYGRVDASPIDKATLSSIKSGSGRYSKSSMTWRNAKRFTAYGTDAPCPRAPYPDGAFSAEVHLRNVFYRMSFTNRDIVALMGAHTIGRAFKDRSGVCDFGSGEQGATPFTRQSSIAKSSGEGGIGMPGGCSWTKNWLTFDNSYYSRIIQHIDGTKQTDERGNHIQNNEGDYLLCLPVDQALFTCPEFHPYFMKYANDQEVFFEDYKIAHKKMSELGCKFDPSAGFTLPDN